MNVTHSDSTLSKVDLSRVTGEYRGSCYSAAQASPSSLSVADTDLQRYGLDCRTALFLLRASHRQEVEIFVEPSPFAYIEALSDTGVTLAGCIIFEGDYFEFQGHHRPFRYSRGTGCSSVLGVAIRIKTEQPHIPESYHFVGAEQIQVAHDYFIQNAAGGFIQRDENTRALFLCAAIRHTMKWLVDQFCDADFSRYHQLVALHTHNNKCSKQTSRDQTSERSGCYRLAAFRHISSQPSVTDALMQGKGALTTFNPTQPRCVDGRGSVSLST